jgi:uncharacterized protein YuzE
VAQRMNNPRIKYFQQEDVLHLVITDEPETRSVELDPNITVELNAQNEMIGVEILNASSFLRDAVLDSIQAKTLQLIEAGA